MLNATTSAVVSWSQNRRSSLARPFNRIRERRDFPCNRQGAEQTKRCSGGYGTARDPYRTSFQMRAGRGRIVKPNPWKTRMAQGQTFLSFFSSRRIGCFTVRLAPATSAVGVGTAKFDSSLNNSFFRYCNVCPVEHVPTQCDDKNRR